MLIFQSIIKAIRKLKQDMRMKNTDQIRIDATIRDSELLGLQMQWPDFEGDISRMTHTRFHCPWWESERPERSEDQFAGRIETDFGTITAWTDEQSLQAMLGRFA